jgi:predicted transcriptional regulator
METTNVSQSIIQNIKRGYMMEAKGDKKAKKGRRYTVTATGQSFISKIAAGSDEEE